jgi:hypothetical protein
MTCRTTYLAGRLLGAVVDTLYRYTAGPGENNSIRAGVRQPFLVDKAHSRSGIKAHPGVRSVL